MSDKAILDGTKVVETEDLSEWGTWMQTGNRRVDKTILPNGIVVSTVFLGMDHQFDGGKPLWFETMISIPSDFPEDYDMDRYETWEESEAGHKAMIRRCQGEPSPLRALADKAPHYAAADIDHPGEPFMPGVDECWSVIKTYDPCEKYRVQELYWVRMFEFHTHKERWDVDPQYSRSLKHHNFYSTRESAERAIEAVK